MKSSVRFSDGLMPKAGVACTICSRRGSEARFRPGDSVRDAFGRQVVPMARRQVGRAVADPPGDAVRQQAGQEAVDGRVRLAQDERQFHRVGERHLAEEIEQQSVGEGHVSSVAEEGCSGQPWSNPIV